MHVLRCTAAAVSDPFPLWGKAGMGAGAARGNNLQTVFPRKITIEAPCDCVKLL